LLSEVRILWLYFYNKGYYFQGVRETTYIQAGRTWSNSRVLAFSILSFWNIHIQTCGSVFLNTHLYALVFLNPQQLSTRASIISPPRTESLPRFTAMMEPPAFLSVFNWWKTCFTCRESNVHVNLQYGQEREFSPKSPSPPQTWSCLHNTQ